LPPGSTPVGGRRDRLRFQRHSGALHQRAACFVGPTSRIPTCTRRWLPRLAGSAEARSEGRGDHHGRTDGNAPGGGCSDHAPGRRGLDSAVRSSSPGPTEGGSPPAGHLRERSPKRLAGIRRPDEAAGRGAETRAATVFSGEAGRGGLATYADQALTAGTRNILATTPLPSRRRAAKDSSTRANPHYRGGLSGCRTQAGSGSGRPGGKNRGKTDLRPGTVVRSTVPVRLLTVVRGDAP